MLNKEAYKKHLRAHGYSVVGDYTIMRLKGGNVWIQKISGTTNTFACVTVYRGPITQIDGPYQYTEQGRKKAEQYIKELKAKQKEILDAGKDTCDETNLPSLEDILSDVSLIGLDDEELCYYNSWGVTDHYNADFPLLLSLGSDIELS